MSLEAKVAEFAQTLDDDQRAALSEVLKELADAIKVVVPDVDGDDRNGSSSIGEDRQMLQLQLQDVMQKQAQLMQSLSNVMKAWSDTMRGIIANMK